MFQISNNKPVHINKWDSAEIFVAVIDEGSFTAAADSLGLSKAHVSRQINQLETRLGIQLIKRSTRKIARRRLIVCCTRDYFYTHGKPEKIADLRRHNCLVGTLPSWRFRESNGRHLDVKIEGNWHSNNGYALMAAARKGLGLVQLPEFYVFDDIRDGRLIPVLQEFEAADTAEWVLYPSSKHLSPKVRLFIDHLAAEFKVIDYL